jgi:N-acetylglucosamine kinase-like BadF-type ATPase
MTRLIADSGATKTEWCLLHNGRKKTIITQGLSPFFLNEQEMIAILNKELWPKIKGTDIAEIFFYGTGCSNPENKKIVRRALLTKYKNAKVSVNHDMEGAAKGLCQLSKGVACILGTGSSACFYDGKKITKSRTGLGYALGDEGSGSFLGRRVLQYYLYQTFDEELHLAFEKKFPVSRTEILEQVYKHPFPQRYIASFCLFLSENRGHYMIENILEDGLNEFFFHHIIKFNECWKYKIHFVGGIAFAFKDVILNLCNNYGLETGNILQRPMDGLLKFYKK